MSKELNRRTVFIGSASVVAAAAALPVPAVALEHSALWKGSSLHKFTPGSLEWYEEKEEWWMDRLTEACRFEKAPAIWEAIEARMQKGK